MAEIAANEYLEYGECPHKPIILPIILNMWLTLELEIRAIVQIVHYNNQTNPIFYYYWLSGLTNHFKVSREKTHLIAPTPKKSINANYVCTLMYIVLYIVLFWN